MSSPNPFHVSIASTEKVANIAKDLFDATDLDFFSYGRNYNDGSIVTLQSDLRALEHMFEKRQKLCGFYLPDGKYFWENAVSREQILQHRSLGYQQGYLILRQAAEYKEIICFAAKSPNMNIMNLFLNHANRLENFTLYFKDVAAGLIEEASKDRILIPNSMKVSDLGDTCEQEEKRELPSYKLKKFNLASKEGEISLSKREFECLQHQVLGLTADQSADKLGLSRKSVEAYLSVVRSKFKVKTRSELMNKIWMLNLVDMILI